MTWRGVGGSTGRSRHVEHPLRKQFGQVCTGLGMAAVLPLPTVASAHGRWTYPGWPSARASGRCPWRLRTLRSRRVQSGARVALARFAASHHASCHHRIGSNHRKRRGVLLRPALFGFTAMGVGSSTALWLLAGSVTRLPLAVIGVAMRGRAPTANLATAHARSARDAAGVVRRHVAALPDGTRPPWRWVRLLRRLRRC